VALDTRIQQLPARLDNVLLSPIEIWRLALFGDSTGTGPNQGNNDHADTDGISNLLEFGFGTDPNSALSGASDLIYNGTFAGNGAIGLNGQPITRIEAATNGFDFRAYLHPRVFGGHDDLGAERCNACSSGG
jgi:hypothetical protein